MDVTRAGNLLTTHTAVAAGFDRFDAGLIRKYLTYYAEGELAIPIEALRVSLVSSCRLSGLSTDI